MSESFKEVLYKNYLSTHTRTLYGKMTLQIIQQNFPVWNHYYESHLPQDKEVKILDMGCGNGAFVYYLQQKGYHKVMGIDVSQQQIDEGKELGITSIILQDAVTFLRDSKGQFDCIVARDVIEHFTKQEAFDLIQLISGALRLGGRFIMQVPNGQGIFYTFIYYGDYTHEMAYTESSVRQLFLNTGFSSSFCYPTGPVPHGFVSSVRWLLWKLKVMNHRFWKMVETGSPRGIFTSNLIAVGFKNQ